MVLLHYVQLLRVRLFFRVECSLEVECLFFLHGKCADRMVLLVLIQLWHGASNGILSCVSVVENIPRCNGVLVHRARTALSHRLVVLRAEGSLILTMRTLTR